jgi:hypothetical protein
VLAAATAFGKTVVAAALIAQRARNTLVLIHRRELLAQWAERLRTSKEDLCRAKILFDLLNALRAPWRLCDPLTMPALHLEIGASGPEKSDETMSDIIRRT